MTAFDRIMERLDEMFPDRNMLSNADIQRYTGWDYRTIRKKFGIYERQRIDKVVLAQRLSEEAI